MIVSFDLDDTLFVNPNIFKVEKALKFPYSIIYRERLRLGTIELLSKIKKHKIDLWIYTTSFRSERYIKSLFKHYGIKIDNIINGERHNKEVQKNKKDIMPLKYPSKYRIDLHIDDDISVVKSGDIYGFKVYWLKDNSTNWVENIWDTIENIIDREQKI